MIGQLWLFRQQVSRHDGISSFSIVMTACSFENVLKHSNIQHARSRKSSAEKAGTSTRAIFSMLDLESLPQKKLGLLAVNKKSTDPLDV